MTEHSLKGRLLVASPALSDPNFARSVVLVLAHEAAEGAIGVIVNRPSEVDVLGTLEGWDTLAADPPQVFVGGPVEAGSSVIGLARTLVEGDGVDPVLDGAGVLDLARRPGAIAADVAAVRIFAGYAGWAPGQLEMEIEAGGWFVLDADADDAFTSDPEDLWKRVLRRQGGVFATFPDDPSSN